MICGQEGSDQGKQKNSLTAQRWLEAIVRLAQKMHIEAKVRRAPSASMRSAATRSLTAAEWQRWWTLG